jgi:phage protein D
MSAALAVVSSRPSFSVGGQDRPQLTGGLMAMRVHEHVRGLYACEATFGNWGPSAGGTGFLYFDRQMLDFGKDFAVSVSGRKVFSGRVMGLEAEWLEASPPALTVLAEDRFQDLRMTRRTRTFDNVTDESVFRTIAGDHGLTPSIDVNGPQHVVLAQVNQSDLAFMRERARAIDAELWIEDSTLNVKSHASRGGAPLRLGLGSGLRSFTILADLADQRSSVDVTGWDVSAKNGLKETATDSVLGAELHGGQSGATVLQQAIGERKETVVHSVPLSSGEAKSHAEALFRQRARRFLHGRGVAEPNPALRVGASIRIEALGPLFSGEYYVSEVKHVFENVRGLRTEFAAERPGLGASQ